MVGGTVSGGKILGTYPSPLSPESDYWLGRGRWIPTTPWEAVFNSISQWMGVHSDMDLDEVLPNRESFSTCSLFSDKDLFVDGACQCVEGATICDDITYAPTVMPTESPSDSPTKFPSSSPTPEPTKSPSETPTDSPSMSPTATLPEDGVLVGSIFNPDSQVDFFGCNSAKPERAVDNDINNFWW